MKVCLKKFVLLIFFLSHSTNFTFLNLEYCLLKLTFTQRGSIVDLTSVDMATITNLTITRKNGWDDFDLFIFLVWVNKKLKF